MSSERRNVVDRRRRATPAVSRYTLRAGRRRTVRRGTDIQAVYVDRLPAGILSLVLAIFAFHVLDALFTLLHLSRGGVELNPLMDYCLRYGPTTFLTTKLGLAAAGLLFLCAHCRWPFVRRGIAGLFILYAGVICYHLVLIWKVGISLRQLIS
jgi:hypothetical protein